MSTDSILLVGHFRPGDLGSSYQRAFQALGIQTHVFDTRDWREELGWLMRNRIAHRLTINNGPVRAASVRSYNRSLAAAVKESGAKAVLILTLEFILAETIRRLRLEGVRVACFFPDNPFRPHANSRPETLPMARATDLCLIWSERLVTKLRHHGVPNPAFLPFAWDPEAFPYQGTEPQGSWPGVLFIGGWDREREAFLTEVSEYVPLRIYGPSYWGTRTRPWGRARRCWQGSDLRLADAARVIRESAVCLNILRTQHIIDGQPDGLIMRHFEVPGAGGFLLSTRGGGATTLFPEEETGEYFSDVPECIAKAKKYIANAMERTSMVARAHAAVAASHQYTNRARQIIELLDNTRRGAIDGRNASG